MDFLASPVVNLCQLWATVRDWGLKSLLPKDDSSIYIRQGKESILIGCEGLKLQAGETVQKWEASGKNRRILKGKIKASKHLHTYAHIPTHLTTQESQQQMYPEVI